jgi:hypothetical protein
MPARRDRRTRRIVLALCLAGGALLTLIGIRYFLVPQSAARTFGVPDRSEGFELHYVVGLRNVWLGLLAVAFATQREWRALALWFTAAVVVCFADGLIAATSTGSLPQVAFHLGCGVASAVLAVLCWRASPASTVARPRTGDFAALHGNLEAFQRWRQAPDRPL